MASLSVWQTRELHLLLAKNSDNELTSFLFRDYSLRWLFQSRKNRPISEEKEQVWAHRLRINEKREPNIWVKGLCELKASFRGHRVPGMASNCVPCPDRWLLSPAPHSFHLGTFSHLQDDFSFTINGIEIHSYRERSFSQFSSRLPDSTQRKSQFGAKVSWTHIWHLVIVL